MVNRWKSETGDAYNDVMHHRSKSDSLDAGRAESVSGSSFRKSAVVDAGAIGTVIKGFIRKSPGTCLGIAVVMGVALGWLVKR